jgi:ADP-heptose:LPS heptosyltransferase
LRGGEAEMLAGDDRIVHLGGELADFADTAAVIALCDLVISVDTAVAHLAGAMGKPVFILLPFSSDWRWMLDRADTPWYPTARLFRQPALQDWDGVIAQVQAKLAQAPSWLPEDLIA